jgi:hypothetical protein
MEYDLSGEDSIGRKEKDRNHAGGKKIKAVPVNPALTMSSWTFDER